MPNGWQQYFHEQRPCECGHWRYDHRRGLLYTIRRILFHEPVCTMCGCNSYVPGEPV